MAKKQHKTNAMRILDTAGIDYDTAVYEVDESDLSGAHVAALLGQSPDRVFKTLVLSAEGASPASEEAKTGHLVCVIPSSCELDLKKAARAAGCKKVEMVPMKTLFDLTGYIRGGCSPLGMKKAFPTYIDETGVLFESVAISAGERGGQIIVNAEELATVIGAGFCDLCV